MRRRVYRSLDHPATVFGIRGRFLWGVALGGALALIIGMVVGAALGMLAGVGVGFALTITVYFVTLSVQARISEKELLKRLIRRSYPGRYRVHPKHIRNIWRGWSLSPASPSSHDQ